MNYTISNYDHRFYYVVKFNYNEHVQERNKLNSLYSFYFQENVQKHITNILAISQFPPNISGAARGTEEFLSRLPRNVNSKIISYLPSDKKYDQIEVIPTNSNVATGLVQGLKFIIFGLFLGIKIIIKYKPKIIYTKNLSTPSIIGYILSAVFKIPLIIHTSGTDIEDQKLHLGQGVLTNTISKILKFLIYLEIRHADKLIFNCLSDKKKLITAVGQLQLIMKKSKIINNGVDFNVFSRFETSSSIKKIKNKKYVDWLIKLNHKSKNLKRIILVGKDIPQKNYDLLPLLANGLKDVAVFSVCGRKKQISDPSNLFSIGEINDVRPFLFNSDIYLSISKSEGISNAMLEAMSMEIPVLTTNVGDNGIVIENSNAGNVLKNLDINLESEIRQLLGTAVLDNKGKLGRKWILENRNWDNQSKIFCDFILPEI
ncbi:MAG: hypothetical protein HeimC2_18000 [Candidatus Heimdallarchaeota archaeon LC_2]|nr:MAG: hypothetical protein HeimC2_18000 [Candidatus Heimdallarchaeota archaeon LC_2]